MRHYNNIKAKSIAENIKNYPARRCLRAGDEAAVYHLFATFFGSLIELLGNSPHRAANDSRKRLFAIFQRQYICNAIMMKGDL